MISTLLALIALQSLYGRDAVYWLRDTVSPDAPTNLLLSLAAFAVAISVWKTPSKQSRLLVIATAIVIALLLWGNVILSVEVTHILSFAALGLVSSRLGFGIAFAILFLAAVGDEVLQYILPARVGDIRDVAINLASGLFGMTFAWLHRTGHETT